MCWSDRFPAVKRTGMMILENRHYWIFQFFWLIALLPKPAQLFAFGGIAAILLLKDGFKLEETDKKFFYLQGAVLLIYAAAIIFGIFQFERETNRILAAANTFLITFIALLMSSVYHRAEIDARKIGKYAIINVFVMFAFWLVYRIAPNSGVHLFTYSVTMSDRINGMDTIRFGGMMAYPNLVTVFLLINIPFALAYLEKKQKWLSFLFFAACFVIVYETGSRMGEALILLCAAFYVFSLIKNMFNGKTRRKFYIITAALFAVLFVIFFGTIQEFANNLFFKRDESNAMRRYIYESSWQRMWENNPFIGMGIKDALAGDVYPYGSHSSYLGFFYKTGIVGGVLYLLSFLLKSVGLIRWKINTSWKDVFRFSFFCVLSWMVLEDLDGVNWSICLFYAYMGILWKTMKRDELQSEKMTGVETKEGTENGAEVISNG